jgi:transcriptional regulator with XRE-family HTH domain
LTHAFPALLGSLVRQHGCSKAAFAHSIGIAPSALSRLLTSPAGTRPPSTDLCLRIARVGGVPPSAVLRAAGRLRTADLIEELYGPARDHAILPRPPIVTAAELVVLDDWRRLTRPARRALTLLLARSTPQPTTRRRAVRG